MIYKVNDINLAFFVYCRPIHTKKVIESIKKNHFKKIYIFQDGLKSQKDRVAWDEVNTMIYKIDFVETEIHISKKNKGLANSIIDGVNYVLSVHETVVVLEDDIVLGEGYSDYAQICFGKYRDNPNVMCISGGGWPCDSAQRSTYLYDVYFSYRMSSVAWGTWKDRWCFYKRDLNLLPQILRDPQKKKIMEMFASDFLDIIKAYCFGEIDSWAIFWGILQIEKMGVCVLPCRSLAKDIGRDGQGGTNTTTKTNRYCTKLYNYNNELLRLPEKVIIDEEISKEVSAIVSLPSNMERLIVQNKIFFNWIKCKQEGRSLVDILQKKGVENLYIYGDGRIAELVVQEIENDVKILGFIVLDKTKDRFLGYPIWEIGNNVELHGENILITVCQDVDYISYSLKKKSNTMNLLNIQQLLQ